MDQKIRTLGTLVAIMALIGGGYAIIQLFNGSQQVQSSNQEAVGNYAAAFVKSYFTYTGQGFESIAPYTELRDMRKQGDNVIKQEVLAAVPLSTSKLSEQYLKSEIFTYIKTTFKKIEGNVVREEVKQRAYLVQVNVMDSTTGMYIVHYPSLMSYVFGKDKVPYPNKPKEEILPTLKPFLESFFRQYFVANVQGELASFFGNGATIPEPMHKDWEYVSLGDVQVYGEQMPYIVYATLTVKHPESLLEMPMTYELMVGREGNKYVIQEVVTGGY